MKRLAIESWFLLLYVDWIMRFREFTELHQIVRVAPVHQVAASEVIPNEELCRAMGYACVFYFKRVLCLQRSAATTLFLRRNGWNAQMVIGAQTMPFKSHAWCEIDSAVVNDKPYIAHLYSVLERC